jgi:hypothetical protein
VRQAVKLKIKARVKWDAGFKASLRPSSKEPPREIPRDRASLPSGRIRTAAPASRFRNTRNCAQAEKLGITLGEFQQLQFEKTLRPARKTQTRVPRVKA